MVHIILVCNLSVACLEFTALRNEKNGDKYSSLRIQADLEFDGELIAASDYLESEADNVGRSEKLEGKMARLSEREVRGMHMN